MADNDANAQVLLNTTSIILLYGTQEKFFIISGVTPMRMGESESELMDKNGVAANYLTLGTKMRRI